jgi:hypothetical protein
MTSDLSELLISHRELEHLTHLEIGPVFVSRTYRPSALKHPKGISSFLLAQLLAIGIISIITLLPVSRFLDSSPTRNQQLPIYCGTITLAILLGGNYYLIWRQRQARALLRLLDEVDRFNQVIRSAALMQQLSQVGSTARDLSELLEVLSLTRQNLLDSLQIDRLLRNSQRMNYVLWRNIEENLAHLQQIDSRATADEYSQILTVAGQISQDIYRELHP